MTEHAKKTANSPSRRRHRKSSGRDAEQRRKLRLRGGLAALAVLGAIGCAVTAWLPPDAGNSSTVAGAGEPTASAGGPPARRTTEPPRSSRGSGAGAGSRGGKDGPTSPSSSTSASSSTSSTSSISSSAPSSPSVSTASGAPGAPGDSGASKDIGESDVPVSGPGTFAVAPGTGAKVGRGPAQRYRVEVETGIGLSLADTAREVERVMADPRGWIANGRSGFQRVASGPVDFVVDVATPTTVDNVCAKYGLNTGGEVNCSVGQRVMVNLKRWLLATPVYAKDVESYRALILNHEVGHFLGQGHVGCPGRGEPAPAMMQQIKGMNGCVPNVWPYDTEGSLITGPSVP